MGKPVCLKGGLRSPSFIYKVGKGQSGSIRWIAGIESKAQQLVRRAKSTGKAASVRIWEWDIDESSHCAKRSHKFVSFLRSC